MKPGDDTGSDQQRPLDDESGAKRPTNPDESGRIRAERLGDFPALFPNVRSMDHALVLSIVALAVVAAVLSVSGAAGLSGTAIGGADQQQPQNATNPGPGAHAAGIVAVSNQSTHAVVNRQALRGELDAADSPEHRADILDRELQRIANRLDQLETQHRVLVTARENGTVDKQTVTARSAAIGAAVVSANRTLTTIRREAAALPPDVRSDRDFQERIDQQAARAETLRERTTDSVRTIDGEGRELRGAPISTGDVRAALDRTIADQGRLEPLLGSERIDLHVRAANGGTKRYAVRVEDGAVADVRRGTIDDPSLRVYTDYAVIRSIQRADAPWTVARTALAEERINYEGVGILSSLKYGLVAISQWIADLF